MLSKWARRPRFRGNYLRNLTFGPPTSPVSIIVRLVASSPMVTDDYLGYQKGVYVRLRDGDWDAAQENLTQKSQTAEVGRCPPAI